MLKSQANFCTFYCDDPVVDGCFYCDVKDLEGDYSYEVFPLDGPPSDASPLCNSGASSTLWFVFVA